MTAFQIRCAVLADAPAIEALIARPVLGLQAGDYSLAQIAGALGTVFGVDSRLIADGTYLVAVTDDGRLAGCGGWSKRRTVFGGDRGAGGEDGMLDPAAGAAKIRAFFVDPDQARRGIGGAILEACEREAMEAGFRRFELAAAITGERLYRARGYQVVERIEAPLANGTSLPSIRRPKGV
jgi:GNAT superfamily N-acetyltransferase